MSDQEPCPWAVKNPDKAGGSRDCLAWRRVCKPADCYRKRDYQNRRRSAVSAYRKFPGNPYQVARRQVRDRNDVGVCSWCGGEILRADGHAVDKRRTWHSGKGDEPDCLGEYFRHTRAPDQLAFLIERDGIGCAICSKVVGRWKYRRAWKTDEFGGRFVHGLAHEENGVCRFTWSSGLQVDHVLALALVVLEVPEAERWRYWGPVNLQALCDACHKAKTAEDVRRIKAARALAELGEAI